MNDVPPPPPAPEWRLGQRPGLAAAPYPKLSEVPPRPTDLPSEAGVSAKVEALEQDNAKAGETSAERPDGTTLGGPPPARIEPLFIPGVGTVGKGS